MVEYPFVSVIMPVYNESAVIEAVLNSLMAQERVRLELLVIDGRSTDGSLAIIKKMEREDQRIRLLVNEFRTTPYALNIGLDHAQSDFVCIMGAHCRYQPDYIATCLSEMLAHDAVGCSGRIITHTTTETRTAKIVSWVLQHRFGVSGKSFRTSPEGYVDSVGYPVFDKAALLQVGKYDVTMTRNQDNLMNYRLRKAGYQLYCTWKTSCIYYARPNLRQLISYAWANGRWCGISAIKEPRSLGLRHYMPAAFVLTFLLGALLVLAPNSFNILGAILLCSIPLHLLTGILFSIHWGIQKEDSDALLLPPLFFLFHATYGFSFWQGLLQQKLKFTRE
jgi:glycosyltransferase involved in cell wall biosynthesis